MEHEFQTHFETSISPAHSGHQSFLHQDIHYHLADPLRNLLRPPIAHDLHRPLWGQTSINDFMPQQFPGFF
jgi:hypothetical protein